MLMEGWGCEKDEAKGRAMLERSRAVGSAAARQLLCQAYRPATGAETLSVSEQLELMRAAAREFVYPAVERRLPGILSKPLKAAASCLTVLLAAVLVVFAAARWLWHLLAS